MAGINTLLRKNRLRKDMSLTGWMLGEVALVLVIALVGLPKRLDLSRAHKGILVVNDDKCQYQWRLISKDYTNPYDAKSIEDEEWGPKGWRLPTYNELTNLFRCIREEDQDGEVFRKSGWPDGPYLLSEESGSKYLAYRLSSGILDTLELGDDVYTLRIKE